MPDHTEIKAMLSAKHIPFLIRDYAPFRVESPLMVIDPFYSDYNASFEDVLHGEWQAQSALRTDSDSEYLNYKSVWCYECAIRLTLFVESSEQYKALYQSSEFKNCHLEPKAFLELIAGNELALKAFNCITEYVLTLDEALYCKHVEADVLVNRIFHEAINLMKLEFNIDQEIKFSQSMTAYGIENTWVGEIKSDFISNNVPEIVDEFENRSAKKLQIIKERFPRHVQYMRIKHSDQTEFTALDSDKWEKSEIAENSSGQMSITHKDCLESMTENDLQILTTKLGNDIKVFDGERVNVGLCGSSDFGISCMTPYREHWLESYVIRNEESKIVELMIHFDLVDEDDEEI